MSHRRPTSPAELSSEQHLKLVHDSLRRAGIRARLREHIRISAQGALTPSDLDQLVKNHRLEEGQNNKGADPF